MARTERPVPPAAMGALRALRTRAGALRLAEDRVRETREKRDADIRSAAEAGAPTWAIADAAGIRRSQVHNITGGAK